MHHPTDRNFPKQEQVYLFAVSGMGRVNQIIYFNIQMRKLLMLNFWGG